MNKLLSRQRKAITITLIIEVLSFIALVVCFIFVGKMDKLYYFIIAVSLLGICILVDFLMALLFNYSFCKKKGTSDLRATSIIGNEVNEAYNFGKVGLAVTDHNNEILWVNDFLENRISDIVDKNIYRLFPELLRLTDSKRDNSKSYPKITYENRTYEVELVEDARLYIFRDITDFTNIYNYNQKQSPVIGYIAIDNYSDVQMYTTDEVKFSEMLSDVRSMIQEFADESNSLLRKIKDDRYLFVTTKEKYEEIYQSKFDIIDKVSKKYPRGFTLSIGVALGFPDYAKLASMASSALDVALSRGGDQAVVSAFSQPLVYFGGKSDLMPTRNRVKTRTLSNSFFTILKDYKNVIIMGHTVADFDAMGSAFAVALICNNFSIPVKICYEEQLIEEKCRLAIEEEFTPVEMDEMFVSMKDLDSYIHDKTLLILVDHSNPRISIFPEYISKFNQVAVIDHHRPGGVVINSPIFNGIDTSASSTCELITNYLVYNPSQIALDQRTATFLLAGITLDTHSFKEHATNSTFEACAQLKNCYADSIKVSDFLKDDFDEYRQKIAILDNSETPYYGVFVAVSPDTDIVPDVTLSKVADEAIAIKDVQAAFCIGRVGNHFVKISARSDGSVNTSLLMEKLGGGGRFTMSAAKFTDETVESVKKKLYLVLRDYLDDSRATTKD